MSRQRWLRRRLSSTVRGWGRSPRVVRGEWLDYDPCASARSRGTASHAGHARPTARARHAAGELPAPTRRPAAHQDTHDRFQRDVFAPLRSHHQITSSSSRSRNEIRWHDRMEARVAAGVLVLVALSVAAVVVTATRVATRSAVSSRGGHTRRRAVGVLSAGRRSCGVRGAADASHHRAARIPLDDDQPGRREDVATLTQMADSYRQDLNAQFAIVSTPDGTPTATPGWPTGVALPASVEGGHPAAAAGRVAAATSCRSTAGFSRHVGTREVHRGRSARRRDVRVPAGRSRGAGSGADHARRDQSGVGQQARGQQPEPERADNRWRRRSRPGSLARRATAFPPSVGRSGSASSSKARSRCSAIAHDRHRPPGAAAGLGADAGVSRRAA